MRIHSNALTRLEVQKAARLSGVSFTRFTEHGSRKRAGAFDIILTGSSTRRQNTRGATDDFAATWDEWGQFLGYLFMMDPEAVAGEYYSSGEHFDWATGGQYRGGVKPERHKNHTWEWTGEAVTGSYTVHACRKCDAVRRFTGDFAAISAA